MPPSFLEKFRNIETTELFLVLANFGNNIINFNYILLKYVPMDANNNPFLIPIREFMGSKQSSLFKTLKKPQFTGQLIFHSSQKNEWIFYLYLGRIIYATGGEHSVRRWQRSLRAYAPHLIEQLPSLTEEIYPETDIKECWEYDLLSFWLNKQEINRSQVLQIIRFIIVEILFDLTQVMEVTFQLKAVKTLDRQLVLIDAEQVIVKAWRLWQKWQEAKLADRSPNSAPIIKQKENLSQEISPQTFEIMNQLFNGENTLRDLAIQLQQDVVKLTKLIVPYLQLGLIELREVDDLPSPIINLLNPEDDLSKNKQRMIVCVDANFSIVEMIKQTALGAGYQFLAFYDPNLALNSITENKPDFILLALDLPNFNGYHLCTELRKSPLLHNVPIVIMTETLSLIDWVRAKMVGCSDFLSKPLESQALLAMIAKHLQSD